MVFWSTTDKACLASSRNRGAQECAPRSVAYCTRGSVSNWWKGGGDDSVHSSVVAPAPHGLAPASRFFAKASNTPYRKISTPKPEMYEPSDDTRFQPANASG